MEFSKNGFQFMDGKWLLKIHIQRYFSQVWGNDVRIIFLNLPSLRIGIHFIPNNSTKSDLLPF